MHDTSTRDYTTLFCYGTLYERLTAVPALQESADQLATAWNDYGTIFRTLSGETIEVPIVRPPTVDALTLQRTILDAFAQSPVLDRDISLMSVVEDARGFTPVLDGLLTRGGSLDQLRREASYVDGIRRNIGVLTADSGDRN